MIVIKNAHLRRALSLILPTVVIPAVVAIGVWAFDEQYYVAVSAVVAILSLVLFCAGFERKKTGSRRLVVLSVITALSVVGRFIPFFKPITALTILTAIHLGGEAGFLVGAMSALLSDLYFGMGPWMPFQMLAWGLIGLLAGYLGRPMRRHIGLAVAYGVLAGVIFSLVMDVWTVLWYNDGFSAELYSAACISALPHTVLYAVSNVIFLLLLARPWAKRIERLKLKYDI